LSEFIEIMLKAASSKNVHRCEVVRGSSSKTVRENTRSLQTPGQFLVSRNSLLRSPIDATMLEVFYIVFVQLVGCLG